MRDILEQYRWSQCKKKTTTTTITNPITTFYEVFITLSCYDYENFLYFIPCTSAIISKGITVYILVGIRMRLNVFLV